MMIDVQTAVAERIGEGAFHAQLSWAPPAD